MGKMTSARLVAEVSDLLSVVEERNEKPSDRLEVLCAGVASQWLLNYSDEPEPEELIEPVLDLIRSGIMAYLTRRVLQ
jgi:hypothetical protein